MTDDRRDPPTRIDPEDARAGETPHVTRYVLAISMALAVIVLALAWAFMRH